MTARIGARTTTNHAVSRTGDSASPTQRIMASHVAAVRAVRPGAVTAAATVTMTAIIAEDATSRYVLPQLRSSLQAWRI